MKRKLVRIVVLLLMLMSTQLTAASERRSFIFKDSHFQISKHRMFWLDNDRVMFTGYEIDLDKLDKQGMYGREQNIYIWDTRTDNKNIFVKNAGLGCYFRGYIRYSVGTAAKKGPMGQERTYLDMFYSKDKWEDEPPEWEENVKAHPITCKSYRGKPFRLQADIVELLPEHGYLDFSLPETRKADEPLPAILFHRFGTESLIPLPVTRGEMSRHDVHYLDFLDGYVLFTSKLIDPKTSQPLASWRKGAFQQFWILRPDGITTELHVSTPFNRWDSLFPLRKGVFATGRSFKVAEPRGPGDSGAYWIHDEGRMEKLTDGLVSNAAVSPDGCKVAFVREPYDQLPIGHRVTLQLLNICEGGLP